MKTVKMLSFSFFITLLIACKGQNSQTKDVSVLPGKNFKSDTIQPKINVNVNKRYDKAGRVVQFDSSYSYSYSSPNGPALMNNDSVYNNFKNFYNKNFPSLFNQQNNALFLNDSLFKYDFYNDDFFLKRFELNQWLFRDMYRQMDSVKRNFLEQKYPSGHLKKNI